MLRSGLVAIVLIASFGPAAAADDGCEKFAWPLARDRAAFAAADKTTISAGETLAALPAGALVIRLQPGPQASFAMPPERKPRLEQWHGGLVRLPALPKPGIYQITLSDDAWIDVIQNGRYARSVGSTGRSDCPGVRKSVRLDLDASSVVLQVSSVAADTIAMTIAAVN
ncbi:hypothetical protein [Bradyrhizobium valentinum]|uniref:Uncharacterized protein n=1 Tax=Bradyrhizobium valentinum TaxID=1518501 RepID=A0A0R3LRW2_9BRAD|nr:hypothetical protein [Bradyrhizobium valentinum]KRR10743.1 hypothetical protein CP49_32380 [Bradyrhizobium valentinum]KRR11097.1 hypothetical protein CQ10_11870 [Bradyrhizobium valentinum]